MPAQRHNPNPIPPLPGWSQDAPAARLISILAADQIEARFVGGCVRDWLVGRAVKDIDLAVAAPPEKVMAVLEAASLKVIPTGFAHGTLTVLVEGQSYEVTSLRRDEETDGRHARVAFTDDWQADAARRDLTMNALFLSIGGEITDFFGGREDLLAGRVRFVGDPQARMEEDWLRALRLFRFHAHYGREALDEEALTAARQAARGVASLSQERVRAELLRLLEAPNPLPSLQAMEQVGLLEVILPQTRGLAALGALLDLKVPESTPLLRFATLLPLAPDLAVAEGRRLRFSNDEVAHLEKWARLAGELPGVLGHGLDRALQREGRDNVTPALLLAVTERDSPDLRAALDRARQWIAKPFPVKGRDLLALGCPPGPQVGEVLEELEDWWLGQDRLPDRQACLDQWRASSTRT